MIGLGRRVRGYYLVGSRSRGTSRQEDLGETGRVGREGVIDRQLILMNFYLIYNSIIKDKHLARKEAKAWRGRGRELSM